MFGPSFKTIDLLGSRVKEGLVTHLAIVSGRTYSCLESYCSRFSKRVRAGKLGELRQLQAVVKGEINRAWEN